MASIYAAWWMLENARMCNAVDYIVLSGWESTTIDDHSGLVDALRQLKADPTLIHQAAQPEVLLIRPRHYVIARGDTAVVDVHQINERNLTGTWRLTVTASLAGHKPLFQAEYPVQLIGGDTFGQLLKQDITFKVDQPGLVTIHAALGPRAGGPAVVEHDEPLLVVNPQPAALKGTIACCGDSEDMIIVKLYLDDGYSSAPGQRVFDVAINGTTVAKDLDIFAEAGGKDRALVKKFVVEALEGTVRLSVPHVTSDNATLAAVELRDSSGKVVRAVFRNRRHTDPSGNVWVPISQEEDDGWWKPDLSAAIKRARRDATRVVLLTTGGRDADQIAAFLAARGLVKYSGPVGASGPSWMGFWFFGRKHWLLSGLPSNCLLDWPYQITSGNGLMLSGSGVESVIGYGKDHDANIGVAAAVIQCGRGRIVLLALPGLMDSFVNSASGKFQPVTAKRLMFNALNH